ncbi:flagellar biosynthetic protein FliO [Franzmannia qiaohouensis]|uniref:Flagellar protein n=1 Tax=Franzmannia qiaohouensis TaxID=1329370 RepID=A0ABU1HF03_9GAMM|nr:flagellar biosynthetic protein FliO [Halomonas qiaohouensis]MDR5906054.1 flagellar biosynthetic protein FliO [Halomonas qiaohouensis]
MSERVSTPEPAPQVDTSGLAALEGSVGSSDALLGMAALGKTAAALALVVAIIFLCSYLVKRLHPQGRVHGQHLKVVGSTAVGNRERVVIVDVEGTWLVLGVGGGQVSKLHECAAPVDTAPPSPVHPEGGSFATRFASALKQNAGQALGRGKGSRP